MIIFIYLKVQVLVRMIIFIACGGRKSNLSGGSLGSFIHDDEHRISPIFLLLFDAFFLATILQDCISPVKRQCLGLTATTASPMVDYGRGHSFFLKMAMVAEF